MMTIGKRKPVSDLRSIWPKETTFSDWLVSEDGLALLAEDLGVEVEDPIRECKPGDFPCDIVGHALGDENHKIVVENQFGKTNHDHLGKLLTYAAMHSAMTGIWISEYVSDDHRKVIDWLNDNTPPTISLYLAQLKAYQIEDSPVAPQLDVVCRPNLQTKVERGDADEGMKANHIWRKDFWSEILPYIKSVKPPFSVQSPGTDAYSSIAIGRSNFQITLTLTPKRQCIGCELYMTPSWKESALNQLLEERGTIEQALGALDWQPLPGKKAARVLLEAPINPKDTQNREAVKKWMAEKSVAFYKAFHHRVKKLKPDTNGHDDEDAD